MLFLLLPAALGAQELKWDAALGQYQRICDECIMLRMRAVSGEAIEASELTSVLARLASLKQTLQDAKGQMTPAQRLRYEAIRLRYEEVFGQTAPVRMSRLEAVPALLTDALQQCPVTGLPLKEMPPCAPKTHVGLVLFAGVPDIYYGAMVTVSGLRFGGFVKASASIPFIKPAYECFSDGTTPSGYIWTNGKERFSRWAVTAGASFTPWRFLSVYAGAGYGHRSLLWQDVSGSWAAVADRSAAGVAIDGGVLVRIGRFSLLAGASAVGFESAAAEFGIGLSF